MTEQSLLNYLSQNTARTASECYRKAAAKRAGQLKTLRSVSAAYRRLAVRPLERKADEYERQADREDQRIAMNKAQAEMFQRAQASEHNYRPQFAGGVFGSLFGR